MKNQNATKNKNIKVNSVPITMIQYYLPLNTYAENMYKTNEL